MWTRRADIINLIDRGPGRIRVEHSGQARTRRAKKGKVWSTERFTQPDHPLPRVSVPVERFCVARALTESWSLAHGHKQNQTLSSYPPSVDSRGRLTESALLKWYERLLGTGQGKYPIEQQVENKRRGLGRQRWPFACWILTLGKRYPILSKGKKDSNEILPAMCSVMVWELVSQNQAQGTPIAIKPNFNYMVRRFGSDLLPCSLTHSMSSSAGRTQFGCVDQGWSEICPLYQKSTGSRKFEYQSTVSFRSGLKFEALLI